MSRLASMSPAALQAVFAPETSDDLMVLLVVSGGGLTTTLRFADNFTQRLSETDEDVIYGTVSNGEEFVFLPMSATLPTEESRGTMQAQITIHDPRRELIASIRGLTGAADVDVLIVLKSSPDTIEAEFPGMQLGGITYAAGTLTGTLSYEGYDTEPFPAHTFTPAYFPGMF